MKHRRRIVRALGAALLGAFALFAAGNAVVIGLGRAGTYERAADVPSRPVAIVLGARVYRDGTPSPVLADRLATALDLYRRGRVRRILVTGDNGTDDYDEVTAMRNWLLARGVPPNDVVRDHAGFRTYDSMVRAARVFQVRHAVVCTQRFHMARSLFLARHAGIDAVGAVSDLSPYGRRFRVGSTVREAIARPVALLDAWVLGRKPRFLGPPIPVET